MVDGREIALVIWDLSELIATGPGSYGTADDEDGLKSLFDQIIRLKYGRKAYTVVLVEEDE